MLRGGFWADHVHPVVCDWAGASCQRACCTSPFSPDCAGPESPRGAGHAGRPSSAVPRRGSCTWQEELMFT